jgi:hypothetical protein
VIFKHRLAVFLCVLIGVGAALPNFAATAVAQERSGQRPSSSSPAAEVTVTLNEQFFNSLLDTIFTRLKAPSFPLSLAKADAPQGRTDATESARAPVALGSHASPGAAECQSVVVLERETDGVRTAVRFENGRVLAPLAFRGSYSVALLGCIEFQGWADTAIELGFDRQRQILSAHVNVRDIHLSNIPSLANGMIISLVQNSIDKRINPVEILQAAQLSARLPITGSGGALRMRATDVRPEVLRGALTLHIIYEFVPSE